MNKRWLMILPMLLSMNMAQAGSVRGVYSLVELSRLPAYCRGVQQIRKISGDPVPIEEYVKRYGFSYTHLHHYCWALNAENRIAITNPDDWKFQLGVAIGDIDYVLSRNDDPDFVFLPEIYTSRARMLFKLDQPADAIIWLKKAIAKNPNYTPAFARLSDYYAEQGNTEEAIKILNLGIANGKKSDMLSRRLKELQGKPGESAKKSEPSQ